VKLNRVYLVEGGNVPRRYAVKIDFNEREFQLKVNTRDSNKDVARKMRELADRVDNA